MTEKTDKKSRIELLRKKITKPWYFYNFQYLFIFCIMTGRLTDKVKYILDAYWNLE